MNIMDKMLRGSSSKFVINLFKSLGIVFTLGTTSSCSDKMVNKLNRGNEKMLSGRSLKNVEVEVASLGNKSDENSHIEKDIIKSGSEVERFIEDKKARIQSLMIDLDDCVKNFSNNFSILDEDFQSYCCFCRRNLKSFYENWEMLNAVFRKVKNANESTNVPSLVCFNQNCIVSRDTAKQKFLKMQAIFSSREFNVEEKEDQCFKEFYKIYCKLSKKIS